MSGARDPSLRGLDACGCCTGTAARTPVDVANRPGLPAVAYRVGTHAAWLDTLLAALSAGVEPPPGAPPWWRPPLQALTARAGDFTPALLDAWAVVGDVLTFYSERVANESWLRTATERRSVLELARTIGFELAPGVAAATQLAFGLEDAPGSPERVPIPFGTRAQSVPGPDELPQTFETVGAVEARPGWNRLRARTSAPQPLPVAEPAAWLAGAPAPVRPGDVVVGLVGDARRVAAVTRVEPDVPNGRALVTVGPALGDTAAGGPATPQPEVFRQRASVFGHNAADWGLLAAQTKTDYQTAHARALGDADETQWPGFRLGDAVTALDLDATYTAVLVDATIAIHAPGQSVILRTVTSVADAAPGLFGIGGKVTRVGFAAADLRNYIRRETTVFVAPEPLAPAEAPITDPVLERDFPLAGRVPALPEGRLVIVRGRPSRARVKGGSRVNRVDADQRALDAPAAGATFSVRGAWWAATAAPGALPARLLLRDAHGVEGYTTDVGALAWLPSDPADEEVAELAEVARWNDADPEHPVAELHTPTLGGRLQHVYDRATVALLANVAPATHGEAVAERLGSGDGARAFQRFALRQAPLTYTPDGSAGGGASTLEVRVGELLWREVATLFGCGPRDRVYVTRRQDDGTSAVQFGDGREGARLPTGRENVAAAYRKGVGREGNVRARQLSTLLTRPLGVRDVVNPLPAAGGADPQTRDDARRAAPTTVLTLGRVVSLRDYADFARAVAGVAKADAVWASGAGGRGVLLTVAGAAGDDVPEGGPVQTRLFAALAQAGDPYVPVWVRPYRPRRFRVQATLRRDADRLDAAVLRDAQAALHARYGFDARAFGAPVARSDVIATLQNVPGVAAVDLDRLYREDAAADDQRPALVADAPKPGADPATASGAELLVIRLEPGDLEVTS